jgi:nucleoside-diphosphate-sugar epimerase
MRILVTGGAGFIGSHLAEQLLDRGNEVWVLDDLSTGSLNNLKTFEHNPDLHFVKGSVTDPAIVSQLAANVDQIFHLAAAVGVRYVLEDPLRSLITNIRGTEVVLEAANQRRTKVILFSSSEVYGKGEKVPFAEDDDRVLGPTHKLRWAYACGKAVDECLAQSYWQRFKLPVVIVRCFNTCGPRQSGAYGMVIPNMIARALRGEPIQVYGDGQQTRCFSAVGDVVRGVLMLSDNEQAVGEVFNIGSDEEVTVLELAQRIRKHCHSKSLISFVPYEQVYGDSFEDMRRRVPDLAKIGRVTGYRPEVSLDQLLQLTIGHMNVQETPPSRPARLATA